MPAHSPSPHLITLRCPVTPVSSLKKNIAMDNRSGCKPIVRRKNPSFSSSLLDQIYRSIDDQASTKAAAADENHQKTGKKTEQDVDLMMLYEKTVGIRKSASAEYYGDLNANYFPQSFGLISCSTSSDSSFWTSSESETSNSLKSKLAVTTSTCSNEKIMHVSERKLKNECGGFVKAKSKALKMYSDLKKSKATQAISPGSRVASFLNSLFTSTGNTKKVKTEERKYTSANAVSACSSASSFSRSCLSKTPSSRSGKLSDGAKRSVRFYPMISVIMDEVEEHIYKDNGRTTSKAYIIPARNSICGEQVIEKNRRARELLKNYEKRLEECKMMNDHDDDEDCESCTSSDLFELDNLDSVSQRYCEELPVYETTSLDANRAIARGLIV